MSGLKQIVAEAIGRGDFAAAADGCETMLKAGECADAIHLQGILRLMQGDRETAATLLRRARDLIPDRGDVAYDHGVALLAAGHMADAVDAWRQAVGLSPERVDAWRNLALAVTQTAGGRAGSETYRQALARHPQDRELLYNYGNLCFRRGDLDGAAQAQAVLLTAHPHFAAGWINAGMTHKAAGRFDQ